ncbi:MAG: ketoacyl-ACP synthase III [Desulfuromonadaceae bacterium]|nr:ketoacyl-ACP synthase III [Desulfuromonadaceae bacterium]
MAFIVGTSRYLPVKKVDNSDLVQFPEKYRKIIAEKAGILSRRHVSSQCTSDVGANAVRAMLEKNNIAPESIESIICATSSPDRMQPATATRIQELCGLKSAYAFDLNSVCSGAIFALKVASGLISDGAANVLVVAAEVYSKILNPAQLTTFPYFGDGSGSALLSKSHSGYEVVDFVLGSDGSGADVIQVPAGGTMLPFNKVEDEKDLYFQMVGRKVFDFACAKGAEVVDILSERNGIAPDVVISHQANINVIKEISCRSMVPMNKFYINLDRYGNTAAASVLIALDEYLEGNKSADNIFLVAFGGGLSWGGCFLRRR